MPKPQQKARSHDQVFDGRLRSTDQVFDGRLRSTTATPIHHEAIAHPAMPALHPNETFAWTAEHGIQAEAMDAPVKQITADCNSPVVVSPRERARLARKPESCNPRMR